MTMLLGLLVTAAAVIVIAIGIYNRLVHRRVACEEAWASIDVQLKRRYDLIPNLVETVKGYAKHERGTLEAVVQARQAGMAASGVQEQAKAENMLTGALRQLFALAEAYPDLKANDNFGRLQEELSSTENKISFARQHYNASVQQYNTSLQVFPDSVIAGFFSFAPRDFFEIELAEERQAPQVKF